MSDPMRLRWRLFVIPPLLVSFVLFVAPQVAFLRGSFFRNLGFGQVGPDLTLENYVRFVTDGFYQAALARTAGLSLAAALLALLLGFPIAYRLARARTRWAAAPTINISGTSTASTGSVTASSRG